MGDKIYQEIASDSNNTFGRIFGIGCLSIILLVTILLLFIAIRSGAWMINNQDYIKQEIDNEVKGNLEYNVCLRKCYKREGIYEDNKEICYSECDIETGVVSNEY